MKLNCSLTRESESLRCQIRFMIRRDMIEVLTIEAASFEQAWDEEEFLRCLRQRNCIGMVAEIGEQVVGYMIYELHNNHLYVLKLAVAPQYHRHGVGSQMVNKLVSKLNSNRRTHIELVVRESNLSAQLFYRSQMFRCVNVVHGYYEDTKEDGYFMRRQEYDDSSGD